MASWPSPRFRSSFFFDDAATTEIYTLSLHDALPIFPASTYDVVVFENRFPSLPAAGPGEPARGRCEVICFSSDHRSEEHTSELQSQSNLVCRLLLEKKNKQTASAPHCPTRHMLAQLS